MITCHSSFYIRNMFIVNTWLLICKTLYSIYLDVVFYILCCNISVIVIYTDLPYSINICSLAYFMYVCNKYNKNTCSFFYNFIHFHQYFTVSTSTYFVQTELPNPDSLIYLYIIIVEHKLRVSIPYNVSNCKPPNV